MVALRTTLGVLGLVGLWWLGTAVFSATNPILGFMTPLYTANALVLLVTEQNLLGDVGITLFRLLFGLLKKKNLYLSLLLILFYNKYHYLYQKYLIKNNCLQ